MPTQTVNCQALPPPSSDGVVCKYRSTDRTRQALGLQHPMECRAGAKQSRG